MRQGGQPQRASRRDGAADLLKAEEDAELLNLVGNSTRLKLLYLLDNLGELDASDLAEMLGVSVSTVLLHLAKLKAYGMVAPRRSGQAIHYRLTDHPFTRRLRGSFLRQLDVAAGRATPSAVSLQQLHAPDSGRLDAIRVAQYLSVPLKSLAEALGKNYSAVHKTPDAPDLQPRLRSVKRSLEILEQVLGNRAAVLAWLNSPHPDLGGRTPLDAMLQGYPDAVEDMLESALTGTPS